MCYNKKKLKNRILDSHRSGFDKEVIKVPCGTCPSCRRVKCNEWLVRSYFEFLGNNNQGFFVTLDFDDQHLPRWYGKPCFDSRVIGKFLDRLRHEIGSFRYFYSTDYGGLLQRPHYHLALFPSNRITINEFIRAIVAKWQQGSHTNIEMIDSVHQDKLKAIQYVVGYAVKDITWRQDDFNFLSDNKMPPRYRPRVQASKGFGLRALEEGIIKPSDLLSEGVVALPLGKNGALIKLPIPRYYEMKLCYDYNWDPVARKAELIKNEFGVQVSQHRHNVHYVHFIDEFRTSMGLDIHNQEFYKDTIFSNLKWFEVVNNCLDFFEDFGEFVYYRPFIIFFSGSTVIDNIRNEKLIKPNWSYYEAAVQVYEKFQKLISDSKCKIETEKLIQGAKDRAKYRIRNSKRLYNYLVKKHFDFNLLN